jgi:23S rRNA (uridine2552-2'-O)-methyltransferase
LSERWKKERQRDQYYRMAKEKGYRSRAAYKLLEAVNRFKFISNGDVVVDLGAAPGGWLQVARQTVGERGRVIGVDIERIDPLPYTNVITICSDISDDAHVVNLLVDVKGAVNAVVSDVSPNISGAWSIDHARQIYLARKSLEIAKKILSRNGNFFAKLFHGPELKDFEKEAKMSFRHVRFVKPKASKAKSSEVYLLATGFLG